MLHVKYAVWLSIHAFSRIFQSCSLVTRFPVSRLQSPLVIENQTKLADSMNRDEGSYQLSHVLDKLLHKLTSGTGISPDEGFRRVFGCVRVIMAPYVVGQAIIFLPCDFYLLSSSSFFPGLISAAADWMSTILPRMVWP